MGERKTSHHTKETCYLSIAKLSGQAIDPVDLTVLDEALAVKRPSAEQVRVSR